jgi:tRNA(fMet)-specific endonuclease VapC
LVDAERGGFDLDVVIDDEDDVAVAAMTVAEMLVGVELASSRYRPQRESFVADVVSSIPIVPYDFSPSPVSMRNSWWRLGLPDVRGEHTT